MTKEQFKNLIPKESVVLESFDFAIRQSQIEFMLNGRSEVSIDRYRKLKSAYKELRHVGKYDNEGCLIALHLFRKHLENQVNKGSEFKDFLLDEIKEIQYQIDILN